MNYIAKDLDIFNNKEHFSIIEDFIRTKEDRLFISKTSRRITFLRINNSNSKPKFNIICSFYSYEIGLYINNHIEYREELFFDVICNIKKHSRKSKINRIFE
jgi:hypothetical protein